jgi:hypothetical protein
MLLLAWIRTRRERREAELALEAVQGMIGALLGLVEDYRAGKLGAVGALAVDAAVAVDGAPAAEGELVSGVVEVHDRGGREDARRAQRTVAAPRSGALTPSDAMPEDRHDDGDDSAGMHLGANAGSMRATEPWIPAFAGMTGTYVRRRNDPVKRIFLEDLLRSWEKCAHIVPVR